MKTLGRTRLPLLGLLFTLTIALIVGCGNDPDQSIALQDSASKGDDIQLKGYTQEDLERLEKNSRLSDKETYYLFCPYQQDRFPQKDTFDRYGDEPGGVYSLAYVLGLISHPDRTYMENDRDFGDPKTFRNLSFVSNVKSRMAQVFSTEEKMTFRLQQISDLTGFGFDVSNPHWDLEDLNPKGRWQSFV
ncbi:MAG: hypothetical protein AAF203_07180, partial [Pseudomonadota bacterium]